MAYVDINTRKTTVEGRFNTLQFDTLMAQKGYPFRMVCRCDLVIKYWNELGKQNHFYTDMDFYYESKNKLSSWTYEYLIVPKFGFSFEEFLKACADYTEPFFATKNI